jgi:hypothetical protein
VVICEAAGMVPQLATVANPYGVTVLSGSGFDSVTDKYKFAKALADQDRPTEVLHIGDHDPSGAHIFLALQEDVEAFTAELGGEASFTPRYRLPTAPPKKTDKRAFRGRTCQAEALPPDVLAAILRDAIEDRYDMQVLAAVKRREQRLRRQLIKQLPSK